MRAELERDVEAIHQVLVQAFPTAGEARLVDALREAGRLTISLVAEDGGEIVGHIGFSPVAVEGVESGTGLAPLAVRPSAQRSGFGSMLVEAGLAACRERDLGFVVVLGNPAYYGRFGFESAIRWGLRDEFGGGEAFQAQELRAGTAPSVGGLVTYAPEFADLE